MKTVHFCASKPTRKTTIRDPQNYFCLFIIALSMLLLRSLRPSNLPADDAFHALHGVGPH